MSIFGANGGGTIFTMFLLLLIIALGLGLSYLLLRFLRRLEEEVIQRALEEQRRRLEQAKLLHDD